ncbi:hypothetical protein Tco_1085254 [Tanacetum coccineum]
MDTEKPLFKASDGDDVYVHLYRSMIRSLMYLTSSRPDIMFAVCACARFQVTPKASHLHVVKRIFRYLKGKPKLGLWYPRASYFDLVAYSNSDYAGASLDRKSTIGGCQFLGCRLISWQCKKQTVVATSSTEAEYVAVASCYNMVAYLEKPEGSEGFHQIVDFLNASHIRRHLQLADADGISSLPNTKIFEQISLMRASKGYTGENIPLFPTMIIQGLVVQGEGSTHSVESHHTPTFAPSTSPPPTFVADETVHEERGNNVERAATTATSLDVEQGSGGSPRRQDTILGDRPAQTRFERLSKQSHDSPLLRVNTLGSDEGSMTLQELMVFCPTLSKKVESLEIDLKQTKQIYVIQGRYGHDMEFDFDFNAAKEVFTTEKDVSTAETISTTGAVVTTASVDVSTVSPIRNTGVSTADDITMAETLVYIRKSATKDKGKGKMTEYEPVQTKTKLQQEQERLDFEATMRLGYKHRKEKSTLKLNKQECLQSLSIRERGGYTLQQLRGYYFDEINIFFETTIRSVNTFVPIKSEVDREVPKLAAGSSIRVVAEEKLDQESSNRQKTDESSELAEELRDKEADELRFTLKALESTIRSSKLEIILREGNRHLHTGREGVSIVKGNSYIDAGRKALGGSR